MYQWEGYQRQVYEYFKGDGSTPVEQLVVMQSHAERARAAGAALPPGFRAHMAMLHLRLGRDDQAQEMIEQKRRRFPSPRNTWISC